MVHNETIDTERRVGARPTGRTALAGLAGIVGGAALVSLSLIPESLTGAEGSVGYVVSTAVTAAVLGLFAIAVVGAHRRYGREYGLLSAAVAGLFAFTLAFLGLGELLYALNVDAFTTGVLASVGDFVWLGMLVSATLFGVALWRTSATRRTAALFAVGFPAMIAVAIIVETVAPGLEDAWYIGAIFGVPIGLAFVSLGLDLRSARAGAAPDVAAA